MVENPLEFLLFTLMSTKMEREGLQTTSSYIAPNSKPSYNWIEITDVFKESVKDLDLGELLHDDLFGLFEAMSAIEMMDPKMDAGMLCNRGARKITSFEQAVLDGLLPLNDLPPTVLLGVIDGTLARLVSWLEGHSLAQTVFTCLYLHGPYASQDKALKVFCLAIYKLLDVIKDLLHKAMVYEEEDFQPMQYGFHLTPDISEQRMIGMLREVEEELHKKARNKQCEPETQAIFSRIKFIRIFLQVLNALRKEDQQQQQNSLNDCQRLLISGIEMLQVMKETVTLGQGAKDGEEELVCFEPSINQRLLPPTFPRYTKIKKREEAIAHFIEMMERLKVVCKAQGLTTFHQAVELFSDFSQSAPCLVSRSALQIVGRYSGSSKDALREALRVFCGPHALSSRAIPAARAAADTFLARAVRPAGILLQISGYNRARQRDKLAMLLEELAILQDEAERADSACAIALGVPSRSHFATWGVYHTLRAQALYLLAGFELELYAEHEYYYIYWYLYECIYGWLISTLSRADSLLQEAWNGTAAATAGTKGGRRQKPNKAAKRPRPHSRDTVKLQALQQLCGGYFKALLGLLREGLLQAPLPGFDRERVRFEHRFLAFGRLPSPPSATYRDFRTAAQAAGVQGSEPLFLSAGRHFAQAGQLLAAGGPAEAPLARTAKTNFVLLRLLAAGHRPKIKPTFCFNESKHFPVICLTEGQLTHE